MECPVCLTGYDKTVRRPRSMPCGHTNCSTCIDGIVEHGHVTCPTCRVSNAVPKGGEFPVNYAMEELLLQVKDSSSSSPSAAAADCQLEPPCRSGKISSLLQQQETKVLTAISTCQEVQAQLGNFQTTLADWCQQQQHLENSLQTSREMVQQKVLEVAARSEVVKTGEQNLNAALEALRTLNHTNSPQEAYAAIVNADKCIDEEEQSTKESQGMLLEVADATADAARKMTEVLRAVLQATQSVQATNETVTTAVLKPNPAPHPTRTVTVGLEELMALPTLNVTDLRKLSLPVRRLLVDGKAFAVTCVYGVTKYSSLSISGHRVFLHAVQDKPLPLGAAAVIQVDSCLGSNFPCTVFLDLSWPGSPSQRVEVKLSDKTRLSQNFMWLCTGQRGDSFLNSRMFMVQDKGQPGETVCGGKHKCDGVMNDIPIVVRSNEKLTYSCRNSGKAGVVRGWHKGSHFAVITRDTLCGEFKGVFGEVVQGLDALMAAAQHTNITEVTVVDCGVVLFE